MTGTRRQIGSLLDLTSLQTAVQKGDRLLVAVSGGADSLALLMGLKAKQSVLGVNISAVHVNHGLRAESRAEEDFVIAICANEDIDLHVRRLASAVNVEGGSAEAHWRRLRYAAFKDVLRESHSTALLLGHNADDLAETFLFHLARGTGVDGLVFHFESRVSDLRMLRPLWKTSRSHIEMALKQAGQQWLTDPSNADIRHSRNLIRHRILPVLKELNPNAAAAIVQASEAIAAAVSDDAVQTSAKARADDDVLDLRALRNDDISRDDFQAVIRTFLAGTGSPASQRQTRQAVQMITQGKIGTVALTDAWTLVVTQTMSWLINAAQPGNESLAMEHIKRFGGIYADLQAQNQQCITNVLVFRTLDGSTIVAEITGETGGVLLRHRKPGDRIGNTPLKKLINESLIPWYLRDYLIFVAGDDGQIFDVICAEEALIQAIRSRTPVVANINWKRSTAAPSA